MHPTPTPRTYRRRARRGAKCTAWCHKHKLNERALQRVARVRSQLERHMRSFGIASDSARSRPDLGGLTGTDGIRRALLRGLFANAAEHMGGGHYRAVRREAALVLHPNSVLFKAPPQWLVFHETVTTEKEHILGATKVEKEWLTTLAPHFYMLEERPAKRGALSTPFLEGIKQQRHEEPQAEQGGDANEAATPPRE